MRSYRKELRRLYDRVPSDFQCVEGCFDCCKSSAWTWTEWNGIEHKRAALHMLAPCPYASSAGCQVYAQRPLICRLFGNGDKIVIDRISLPISFRCKRGILPDNPIPAKELKAIYLQLVNIMLKELEDTRRHNAIPIQAGPYGVLLLENYKQKSEARNGR